MGNAVCQGKEGGLLWARSRRQCGAEHQGGVDGPLYRVEEKEASEGPSHLSLWSCGPEVGRTGFQFENMEENHV